VTTNRIVEAWGAGIWLGLTQLTLGFAIVHGAGAAAILFFALTAAWLAGGAAGATILRGRHLFLLPAALALVAGARLALGHAPFGTPSLLLGLLAGAASGAYAGSFLAGRAAAWREVRRLLLHENNGFIAGYVLGAALLLVDGRALDTLGLAFGAGVWLLQVAVWRRERRTRLVIPVVIVLLAASAPARAEPALAWVVESGLTGASSSGSVGPQVGLSMATGARWRRDRFVAEVVAEGRLQTSLFGENDTGRVDADELYAGLGVRLLASCERDHVGVSIDGGGRILDVTGEAEDGRTGTDRVISPSVRMAVDARWRATSRVELRFNLGVEVAPLATRFTLDGETAVDLGRIRPAGGLALVVVLP
jgi:hypothetical protein